MNFIEDANNYDGVPLIRTSTGSQYKAWNDSHFIIMPDAKTILAIDGNNPKHLLTENITDNNQPVVLNTHKYSIHSISFDGVSRVLVGDDDSCLTEFGFDKETGIFTKKHVYENLGIRWIYSIAQLGHLAVVGGDTSYFSKFKNDCVQVIDLKHKQPAKYIIQTAIKYNTTSLQLWRRSKSELVLDVCGRFLNFSPENSSLLFDMSKAIDINLVSPYQGMSKEIAIIEMSKLI